MVPRRRSGPRRGDGTATAQAVPGERERMGSWRAWRAPTEWARHGRPVAGAARAGLPASNLESPGRTRSCRWPSTRVDRPRVEAGVRGWRSRRPLSSPPTTCRIPTSAPPLAGGGDHGGAVRTPGGQGLGAAVVLLVTAVAGRVCGDGCRVTRRSSSGSVLAGSSAGAGAAARTSGSIRGALALAAVGGVAGQLRHRGANTGIVNRDRPPRPGRAWARPLPRVSLPASPCRADPAARTRRAVVTLTLVEPGSSMTADQG